MLEAALAAGIAAAGGDALLGGVLPTPAAAILSSASGSTSPPSSPPPTTPTSDNGIKFFDGQRHQARRRGRGADRGAARRRRRRPSEAGRVRELNGGLEDYLRELQAAFPLDLSGRRVVLDCANGATHRAAPAIFERLGAEVEAIGAEPDGRNINDGCGSTHVEALAERVAASEAEIGFAFDGDGDRVLAVDGSGRVHDGDELIALAARGMAGARRARRRRRRHRDDQLRLPPGDGGGRDRGRRHPGRRPLRDRRDAAPRLAARRRAVRPHHRHRLRLHRRRHRRGADDDARARRRAASRDAVPMEKLPQTLVNVEVADREAIAGRRRGLGGGRARERRPSRAAAASSCAPPAPSRWCG